MKSENTSAMHSPLASPKTSIEVLQAFGLYTKKRLGQHFLIDDNVIARILEAADLREDDQVLEIGPGIGVLTLALIQQAGRVLALEYDEQLLEVLSFTVQKYQGSVADRLEILHEDALNIPQLELPLQPAKLIANLPYQVAATNVLDCFEYLPSVMQATVMVQKEVAQRMAAKPGTKAYGAYSVKLQLLACPVACFDVSRNSFLPPPRVDSSVITLKRRSAEEGLVDCLSHYREVARLVDASFAQRRKTILNNLKASQIVLDCENEGEGEPPDWTNILLSADIDPRTRAEVLNPPDFVRLHASLMT